MGGKLEMKKCGRRRFDRTKRLPDDILRHILSLLPAKDGISAALVSRRWLYLWRRIPSLRFEFKFDPDIDYHVLDVNSALKYHRARTLQEFKIDFLVPKSYHHHVAEWLGYVFSKRVERLDLNLGKHGAIAESNSGVEFDVELLSKIASFKSLKVLCIRCVMVSGEAVEQLLRGCPLLERLLVYRSRRRSHLVVDSPSLRHLDMRSRSAKKKYMDISDPYLREDYAVRVACAPSLNWLTLDQNSKGVFLERVPKLVNLHFFYRPELGDSLHHFANVAAQLETLIIHLFNPEAAFSVPKMPKLKKLVVYFRTNWANISLPVTRFISASPCLEEFRLDISELYTSPTVPVDIFEVPKDRSPHYHLKRFVLSGYCGVRRCGYLEFGHCDVSLELVRYMVDNCVTLAEIVIGQCHRVGLVRDIVDYDGESLDDIVIDPGFPHHRYVATPEQRQAFEETMRLHQIPARIKLRIVYEADTNRFLFYPGVGF